MKVKKECQELLKKYIDELNGIELSIYHLSNRSGTLNGKMWSYIKSNHKLDKEKNYTINNACTEISEIK